MALLNLRRAAWALIGWAAIACGADEEPAASPGKGDPALGGTAVVAFNAEMGSFNPLVNTDLNTMEVNNYLLFTPIVSYDEEFQPRPHLAAGWDLDEAGVTFYLNRDVTWHDGHPVSAHDVAFTFERAKDPLTASILASVYLEYVDAVEVIDSFTVRFHFTGPHARPLDGFWWAPVPKHILESIPPQKLAQAAYNRDPIGSGPFRFVSWEAGASVTFERYRGYAESLGGAARLDRVIFRFIPESTTLLSETIGGGIDVNGSLQPDQTNDIERSSRTRLVAYPSREYYYIGWNTRDPILGDPRVRRALAMAIDRQQLVDALLFGHGVLATGTIAPWHPLYADIEPLPFDPAAATDLLIEAGWTDRDGDGTIESPAGTPFRFRLMTNTENPVRTDIAQVVQARLAEIGIVVDVQTLEWQTLLARHRGRDFQGVVQSWVLDSFRIDPFALFHSSEADREGSYNRSGLSDPEVDRLIEAATRTAGAAEAKALWEEFSTALQAAQPFTFLMWVDELVAVSERLKGAEMDARGILVNVASWWIPADERRFAVSDR